MIARWIPRHVARLLFAAASMLPASALAQTPPDSTPRVTQTVVVTATVSPVTLDTASRSVTILTGEELAQLGVRSAIEALRLMPGVDARARGPRDVQTDFSIRGATFGQNLVLVDGMRLNDSQTGHHNGEIPIPAAAIDRIELVTGAGSSVHGTDALGGTINVITKRGTYALASAAFGQHGYADGQTAISGGVLPAGWTVAGWASRSAGFTFDRDFAIGGAALRADVSRGVTIDVRHQRRAFGANGFYGPSPSKEWTNQTLAGLDWRAQASAWTVTTRALFRDHGDHFRWDINRPGFAENRHRTHAVEGGVDASRRAGRALVTVGASAGGDWVASSNIGDHDYNRTSAFAEVQAQAGTRTSLTAGARFDRYSSFGRSLNPSISAVTSITNDLRLRASLARAFRKPTFTELYYSDPSNLGNPNLVAERAWTLDGGADWTSGAWSGALTIFHRWDDDVIDWVRATPADRWESTNVRDVRARGIEAQIARRWRAALVRASFAGLHLDAPALPLLSKYVLEYARHQIGLSVSTPIVAGIRAAVNVDHRRRRDGQVYELVSAKVSRAFGRVEIAIDGTNLLNESYVEVVGVEMPGRWLTAGVTVR